MPIQETARLYACNRCRIQVYICRSCDRGHSYCESCAFIARKESVIAARIRYEHTYAGKLNNAARQKRYRKRKKAQQFNADLEANKKVTDQGSNNSEICDLLSPAIRKSEILDNNAITCHFCRKKCSAFLRIDFLESTIRARNCFKGFLAQAP
jgi:hypothetical protein